MAKKINIITLGCSKNTYDSELLIGGLKKNDFSIVEDVVDSDHVIINTCGFLDEARKESIDTILEVEDLKNNGKIKSLIVMGCMSERFGDELKKEILNVDRYFGSNDISEIIKYLCDKNFNQYDPDYNRASLTPKHYGYLKISEGCDNKCSFCSIPLMRGLQRSQPIEWNIQEAKRMSDAGLKEILVIAQDSTSYGWDLTPRVSLSDLLIELDKIDSIEWIRLHYAHPAHLRKKIIDCFKNLDKLVPYIDMPIQHASDSVLLNMRRGLKIDGIKNKIEQLRAINENIAIRTSLIVGFPNETEKDFNKLYDFVNEIEFDRLGVFVYSEEEGTYGKDNYKDNVPREVKKERLDELMKLQMNINLNKNKKLIGSTQKVIVDTQSNKKSSIGRTYRDSPEIDNTVLFDSSLSVGKFYDVKIVDASYYSIKGEVINE